MRREMESQLVPAARTRYIADPSKTLAGDRFEEDVTFSLPCQKTEWELKLSPEFEGIKRVQLYEDGFIIEVRLPVHMACQAAVDARIGF